ncbi:sensor histidine kinase [Gorillibacterium sp. sgz5001074]|uniref:sensor histidine kinase n=1 Tax=Gorillibacterium sp. sgz5001074 TaxID=3446695 RepID=UPI003F661282
MKNRKRKNGKTITNSLKALQFKFYATVFLVGTLLFLMLQIISVLNNNTSLTQLYRADTLINQDYHAIHVSGIEENHGSAQIVTKSLDVITLTGAGVIKENKLTLSEWSKYLSEFGKTEVSAGTYNATFAYDAAGEYWLVVAFPASLEIQISMMANLESEGFIRETAVIACIAVLYISIVVMIVTFFSKRSAQQFVIPLQSLKKYTKALEDGKYTTRMEAPLEGEYGELQETFYHLAAELEKKTNENKRMESKKNEMLLDISHDLKNPLSAIQGYAEVLIDRKSMDLSQRDSYLSAIYQNSHRANHIITSLFSYAQIESKDFVITREQTDFCEFIRLRILELVDDIEIAGMTLDCHIPEEVCMIDIDGELIGRVVFNLIGNAVKYNIPGTHIQVTLAGEEGEVILSISDDGCGMDTEQALSIFEPFVREDKARNSRTGGSGLGLSIAKKIVEAHGGTISLSTGVNRGSTFTITLPIGC